MPQNKNQHYVPRCHFKPFSVGQKGDAIHIYNVAKDIAIPNAPLKGQCAKHYFYGRDTVIENFLLGLEGEYATIIRKVLTDAGRLDGKDLIGLRRFTMLQALRTEGAIRRASAMAESMQISKFPEVQNDLKASDHDIIRLSMQVFIEHADYIADLKSCILLNHTRKLFITSDDPAILTNRFHFQRLKDPNFGWPNSGAVLLLPLTPNHMLMCYDALVYSVPDKRNNVVFVSSLADVETLNEFQALYCSQNLYFATWDAREAVRADYRAVAAKRLASRHIAQIFIRTVDANGREYYRLAADEEQTNKGTFLLRTGNVYPSPHRWLSILRFRTNPKTFSNGSAVGHVRKKEWLKSSGRGAFS